MATITTINDIADFARILNEQPEWAETIRGILLGQELLAMPGRLAELVRTTQRHGEQIAELVRATQQHGEQIAELVRVTQQHGEQIAELVRVSQQHGEQIAELVRVSQQVEERLTRVEAQIAELVRVSQQHEERLTRVEAQLAELTERVTTLTERMDALTEHIAALTEQVSHIVAELATKATSDELQQASDRSAARYNNLLGSELERRVHDDIINIASYNLNLRRARILQGRFIRRSLALEEAMDQAVADGIVSDEQVDALELADVILYARRKSDGANVNVVIEISQTVNTHDITRARDRADTMSKIAGIDAIAAAIGGRIAPPQVRLAEKEDVRVVISGSYSEESYAEDAAGGC